MEGSLSQRERTCGCRQFHHTVCSWDAYGHRGRWCRCGHGQYKSAVAVLLAGMAGSLSQRERTCGCRQFHHTVCSWDAYGHRGRWCRCGHGQYKSAVEVAVVEEAVVEEAAEVEAAVVEAVVVEAAAASLSASGNRSSRREGRLHKWCARDKPKRGERRRLRFAEPQAEPQGAAPGRSATRQARTRTPLLQQPAATLSS